MAEWCCNEQLSSKLRLQSSKLWLNHPSSFHLQHHHILGPLWSPLLDHLHLLNQWVKIEKKVTILVGPLPGQSLEVKRIFHWGNLLNSRNSLTARDLGKAEVSQIPGYKIRQRPEFTSGTNNRKIHTSWKRVDQLLTYWNTFFTTW